MNPNFGQALKQSIIQSILSGFQQPQAQLGETQAQTQSAAASAGLSSQETTNARIQQEQLDIQLQQRQALQNLHGDLQSGLTLPAAINKYTALGMNPDDIFQNYLSESPYGTPEQDPKQLQQLGISAKALGNIGTPGSFMDRYNTKNGIAELRGLESTFNQTSLLSHVPFIGNFDATAKAYNAQKLAVADHLSSLIPGASSSQGSNKSFLDSLPDPTDPSSVNAATGMFSNIEKALLQSKGYTPKDLGLPDRPGNQTQSSINPSINQEPQNTGIPQSNTSSLRITGIPAIDNVISNAGKDVQALPGELLQQATSPLTKNPYDPFNVIDYLKSGIDTTKGIAQEYGSLLQNPVGHFQQHPVNTLLDVLPFLAGAEGLARGGIRADVPPESPSGASTGVTGGITQTPGIEVPGNPNIIQKILNPGGIINSASDFRNAIIEKAQQEGKTISGDDIASDIEKWSSTAKRGNLGQGNAIDQAVTDAKQAFGGQNLTPQEAVQAYSQADSGYTAKGIAKTPIQANIDRGLRDVLANRLEEVAPGWQKSTDLFSQGYAAQKSPARTFAKRTAQVGLGVAGLDEIRRILFGG